MLLLGHRGARKRAPENTLTAFSLALEHGCDGFEFDVRCTADGQAVICHDRYLARHAIVSSSCAALRQHHPDLPTLNEVLERFAAHAYLYIELKVAGVEEAVAHALATHPPQGGHVVASFLPEVIEAMHALSPATPLGFICDARRALPRWRELPVQIVMPHYGFASEALLAEMHAAGKQVFVWTVNQAEDMRALAERGVDAILSDDTELLCRTLRRRT